MVLNLVFSPGIFLLCFQCESIHNGLKSEKNVQFRKNSKKVELTIIYILFYFLHYFRFLAHCEMRGRFARKEQSEGIGKERKGVKELQFYMARCNTSILVYYHYKNIG